MRIETERLILRRWTDHDIDALAAIDSDPDVMRYIGDGSVRTRQQTVASVKRFEEGWERDGFGLFALELRDGGELAGWAGFAVPTFLPEILPAVEIGWRLGRRFWGRGLATEAAHRALAYGFDNDSVGPGAGAYLERVVSIHHLDNVASARIMAKLGMTFDRDTTVPSHGGKVRVTAITREQYLAQQ